MRKRALFSLVGALIAAIALVSASGAATTKAQKVTRIDVSTRAAVIRYLRSMHVNPKGAVIQRGRRNYAGPRCPGKGWTCASTRHTVVQVATSGGQNRFVCRTARCAVVQLDGASHGMYVAGRRLQSTNAPTQTNTAACIKTSGLSQTCTINQSSTTKNNKAVVYENVFKNSGLTQTASATASITQQSTASGATNEACVNQTINMEGSTTLSGKKAQPINVALEAHQSITITQDAPNGSNRVSESATPSAGCTGSRLTQSQTLSSTAGGSGASSLTQNENVSNAGPNMSLDIEQNQHAANGSPTSTGNDATFTQTNQLSAVSFTPSTGTVSQTQSSSGGGIFAKVNQDANGVSNADANQVESQCEDAYAQTSVPSTGCSTSEHAAPGLASLTQTQIGPVRKAPGDSTQTGNENCSQPNCDSFTVTQTSQQDSDSGSTQTNTVAGGFHTDGTGSVTETTTVNGNTTTGTQAGTGDVSGSTSCTGSNCTTTTTPPTPIIDSGPTQPSTMATDATFTFHDADTAATFLCQLDGGGYSACTSPTTYNALDPGSHTFSVEAKNPSNGAVSDAASYTWTISSGNANVLIAGAGDFSDSTPTEPNDNLAQALTAAGYSVTESATLPADLSSFGQLWWVDANAMSAAEQNQLISFAESGRGVYLTGERPCCEALNAADQTIVNSVVSAGGVTVGNQGDVCGGCNSPLPVNPTAVGNLATQPHAVTTWQPAAPGGMAGVPASSVFSYYQPGDISTRQVVAAAWDRPSTVGNGRLVVFMDINWPEVGARGANWSDVAENVAFFLSGLSTPPSPIVLLAPRMGLSVYGSWAQRAPVQATVSPASNSTISTR